MTALDLTDSEKCPTRKPSVNGIEISKSFLTNFLSRQSLLFQWESAYESLFYEFFTRLRHQKSPIPFTFNI